jgi:CBS domain-containing protein
MQRFLMPNLPSELEVTLKAFEAGFHVGVISTFYPNLVWAEADDNAAAFLDVQPQDFDQFPVRDGDRTVGVLRRHKDHGNHKVGDSMDRLVENLLISAETPIRDLIPQLKEIHFRLVLRGSRIDGLVTQSDLLKLPVRILIFGLVTHLEQVMADLISIRWPDEGWLGAIGEKKREQIKTKEAKLLTKGVNPPLIELTEFKEKVHLCARLMGGNTEQFRKELDNLRKLRNQIAHAASFIQDKDGASNVVEFIEKFECAQKWIAELTKIRTAADMHASQ